MIFKSDISIINKLRVQSSTQDEIALRLRLGQALSTAEFNPPALNPTAILLIRRLSGPADEQLPLHKQMLRVPAAWERGVQGQVAGRLRGAIRPFQGHIPTHADTVLFVDEAEMLACLVLDLARGQMAGRWWWRLLRKRFGRQPTITAVFKQETQTVPAILFYLSAWDVALVRAVLQKITAVDCLQILRAIAQSYALSAFVHWHVNPSPGSYEAMLATAVQDTPILLSDQQMLQRASQGKPPWAGWLPSVSRHSSLKREQMLLLAICLGLQTRPQRLRAPFFQRAVQLWWRAAAAKDRLQRKNRPASQIESPPSSYSQLSSVEPELPPITFEPIKPNATPPLQKECNSPEAAKHQEAKPVSIDETDISQTAIKTITGQQVEANQHAGTTKPSVADQQAAMGEVEPTPNYTEGVATQLGGVFYLINALERVELWQQLATSGLDINPWQMLAKVAFGLLAVPAMRLIHDPIWQSLAGLANVEADDLLGDQPTWLPAWLSTALPAVRESLATALGPNVDLAHDFLWQNGRFYATRTHVDLVLPLDTISIPIRMAGFDRDPGWLAHYGRIIHFHFESNN